MLASVAKSWLDPGRAAELHLDQPTSPHGVPSVPPSHRVLWRYEEEVDPQKLEV